MATIYVGIDMSKGPSEITIGTSTGSKAVEVVIDDTKVTGKVAVYEALEKLAGKIKAGNWPLA
jgi:histidinol dehydrogenase